MTPEGFEELVRYLEGIFGVTMGRQQRDAYFLTLGPDEDAAILAGAVAYVRSDRARYGLPKPGDLIPQPAPDRPAYLVEAERYEREHPHGALPPAPLTAEESRAVVEALKRHDPDPPRLPSQAISLADRIRAWRAKEATPIQDLGTR